MNPKKSVEVLEGQIQKLEAKDFDLNAWKNFTILLLERIFGRQTKKIEAIQKIKYDQGSWVLRDETGYTNSMEACKCKKMRIRANESRFSHKLNRILHSTELSLRYLS